jgi:hypothetical protein
MSDDRAVIEIQEDGTAVDLTAALAMACTTGFNVEEALIAVSHTCNLCGMAFVGISCVIPMDAADVGQQWWCRQPYSNSCKDNHEDTRAWRKKDGEKGDMEIPTSQWRRDMGRQRGPPAPRVEGPS